MNQGEVRCCCALSHGHPSALSAAHARPTHGRLLRARAAVVDDCRSGRALARRVRRRFVRSRDTRLGLVLRLCSRGRRRGAPCVPGARVARAVDRDRRSACRCYAAGNLLWALWLEHLAEPPIPSVSDGLWLALYPGQLHRARLAGARAATGACAAGVWLDGIVAGLGIGAVGAAIVFRPVLDAATGGALAVATNLAYPIGDLLLAPSSWACSPCGAGGSTAAGRCWARASSCSASATRSTCWPSHPGRSTRARSRTSSI